jgi:hypothetical protein
MTGCVPSEMHTLHDKQQHSFTLSLKSREALFLEKRDRDRLSRCFAMR